MIGPHRESLSTPDSFAPPIILASAVGKVITVSSAAARLFGCEASDLSGDGLWRRLPSESSRRLRAELAAVMADPSVPRRITLAVHDDATCQIELECMPGASGEPDAVLMQLMAEKSVDAAHLAGAAADDAVDDLRRLEERLRLAAEAAGLGVWDLDLRTGKLDWDEGMFQLYGIAAEEFGGVYDDWCERLHPDDREAAVASFNAAMATGVAFDDEFRIRTPEGVERSISARALCFKDAKGAPLRAVGVNYDVTAQRVATRRAKEAAAEARFAHERLQRLADNAPSALFEYREGPDGAISFPFYSAKMATLLGVDASEIDRDGAAAFAHINPDDLPGIIEDIAESRDNLTPFNIRYRVNHPANGERLMIASTVPVREPDGGTLWFGSLLDVTEQQEIEQRVARTAAELEQALERLTTIANVAPAGLYEFQVAPDGRIDCPYFSDRFAELIGVDSRELKEDSSRLFRCVYQDDAEIVSRSIEHSAATLAPWGARFRICHPKRGLLWVSGSGVPRREANGAVVFTAALVDVSDDIEREEELRAAHAAAELMRAENEHQALHDGLTGLPNRRFFDRVFSTRMEEARAAGAKDMLLIRVDLDHFKNVNDTLGHAAGDQVITRVAQILRETIEPGDFVARIGGDEFSVIMAVGASAEDADAFVDRVRAELEKPITFHGKQCRFGASFGVARADDLVGSGEDIQMFADAALYQAKSSGRGCAQWFTEAMHAQIRIDRDLVVELQEAVEAKQFEPYFQPQVDAVSGRLTGVETLLRWRHPKKGVLAPNAFMDVAEQLQLVPALDRMMMEQSRAVLTRMRERGLRIPKISFNVSSGRLHDAQVVSLANSMIEDGVAVTFELLESILVEEESDLFYFHLDAAREAGVQIEIDDFGTGHASIIGLMAIQPHALKIDRRIVSPVAEDQRARRLVRAIVEMAESLDIAVVAEGVETIDQEAFLQNIGCDVLQGFLYSRPLGEEDFARYLEDQDQIVASAAKMR